MILKVVKPISASLLIFSTLIIMGIATATTPTPAPTKTPDANENTQSNEINPEVTATPRPDRLIEPFTQEDLAVLTGNVQRPNGIVWFNDKLFVICNGDWTIYELDDTTGSTRTYIYGVRNGHSLYAEANADNSLNLWVPDFDVSALLSVNQARAPRQITTGLEGPWGIAYMDEDTFLVTNVTGNNIVTITRNGQIEELVSGLRSPTGIATDEAHIYFANNGSSRRSIEWISRTEIIEGESPVVYPLVSGLQSVTNITLASDGYLYFTYSLGTRGVVGRVDPQFCRENEGCTNDQAEIVLYTELTAPLAGLSISPDLRLFIHTIYRPEIYWIQLPNPTE